MPQAISRTRTKVEYEVRTITPSEADKLLALARNKGPMDRRQITSYARDMKAGVWKLNGEPIIVSSYGELLSGRLRLQASIEAKAAFPTLIIRNVDPSSYETIDAIRRRTTGDIMSIRREDYGRALASALQVLWRIVNDDLHKQTGKVSSQQLVELLEANPGLRKSLEVTKPCTPLIPHGLGAALHYVFASVSPKQCKLFFDEFLNSRPSSQSAAGLLKRQLEAAVEGGGRRSQIQAAGLIIRAWEHHKAGTRIRQLKYSPEHDNFPEITGFDRDVVTEAVAARSTQLRRQTARSVQTHKLRVTVEKITPERAAEILDQNNKNRKIASGVVQKYARDMVADNWALNGQTIKIGASGQLLDGQHRLSACVQARRAFNAIIVEGLDDEVFDTFDQGTRRPIANILNDRGELNTALLAGALRQLWLMQNHFVTMRTAAPTVNELLDTLDEHGRVRESLQVGNKVRDIAPPSQLVAVHYWASKKGAQKANQFIEGLSTGAMLATDSPVLKLREVLRKDRENRKVRIPDAERLAIVIKSWNAYYEGKKPKYLIWRNSGDQREEFPSLIGMDA